MTSKNAALYIWEPPKVCSIGFLHFFLFSKKTLSRKRKLGVIVHKNESVRQNVIESSIQALWGIIFQMSTALCYSKLTHIIIQTKNLESDGYNLFHTAYQFALN